MDGPSDDLTKPLGLDRPRRRMPFRAARAGRIALAVAATGIVGAVAGTALYGDPRGGRPVARADISASPSRAVPTSPLTPAAAGESSRREAGRVEEQSGVQVVRGGGAAPPTAIVVEVPPEARDQPQGPDPRLAERTRSGLLPRIGPDGARAIDIYARPVAHLPDGRPALGRIAIVVGGLGLSRASTDEAISRLPAAVSLAFAPYGLELERDSARARQAGHELLVQIPMEPFDYPDSDPGPRTLTVSAKAAENLENLRWAMGRFPGYVAIMNYMGGRLTAEDKALAPILREAEQRGLGFLDDGSSSRSRVLPNAGDMRVARGDLVIDGVPRADMIDKALQRLEAIATSGRVAVATASALPVTIDRIAAWSSSLEERGILLVPVSAAMAPRRRDSASR